MAKPSVKAAGGMAATWYVLKKGREAGGYWKLYQRMRSRNACKTCALGMGGQQGGMRNEAGHFPEVCKKSIQAQAGDMAGHTVVMAPLIFERGTVTAEVHCAGDGAVSDLRLSPTQVMSKPEIADAAMAA
jgi:hypothetical protein